MQQPMQNNNNMNNNMNNNNMNNTNYPMAPQMQQPNMIVVQDVIIINNV